MNLIMWKRSDQLAMRLCMPAEASQIPPRCWPATGQAAMTVADLPVPTSLKSACSDNA